MASLGTAKLHSEPTQKKFMMNLVYTWWFWPWAVGLALLMSHCHRLWGAAVHDSAKLFDVSAVYYFKLKHRQNNPQALQHPFIAQQSDHE